MNMTYLLMSDAERRSRAARWRRRYPTLEAWTDAHPNEAVGHVLEMPPVRYYKSQNVKSETGWSPGWTVNRSWKPSEAEPQITQAEWREMEGIKPEDFPPLNGDMPKWPPTPEYWGKPRAKLTRSKALSTVEAIEQVKGFMLKYGITVADLGATAKPPVNGYRHQYEEICWLLRQSGLTPRPFEVWLEGVKEAEDRNGGMP